MKSIHPYEPFIPEGSTKLIIGTIPPHRFCDKTYESLAKDDVDFYYGSRDNYFWELLGKVFKVDFKYENTKEAVQQRKDFLTQHKMGITDIISECERKDGSSKDEDLSNIVLKDLSALLAKHPEINTLIYTSEFVKKPINEHFKTYHHISKENKRIQFLKFPSKTYEVRILFSPSPLALMNLGENGEEKRLNQYIEFFNV